MLILEMFLRHNLIKRSTKAHQNALYFQNFLWGASIYAPELPLAYMLATIVNIIIST